MKYTIKLFKFLGYLVFFFSLLQVVNFLGILVGSVWCFYSISIGVKILGSSVISTIITHILFMACKYAGDLHIKNLTTETEQRLNNLIKETE